MKNINSRNKSYYKTENHPSCPSINPVFITNLVIFAFLLLINPQLSTDKVLIERDGVSALLRIVKTGASFTEISDLHKNKLVTTLQNYQAVGNLLNSGFSFSSLVRLPSSEITSLLLKK